MSLRRTAHARHAFDFDAFTPDVLVLDLARMRAEGFSRAALPLVEEFGLGDVEALHYLVGPDRATVPPHWAVVPTRSPLRARMCEIQRVVVVLPFTPVTATIGMRASSPG